MYAQLEEIKPIEVSGQEFMITVLRIRFDEVKKRLESRKNQTMFQDYFNAYVYLPYRTDKMEELGDQTYSKDKVVGVDTAHAYNDGMLLEGKKKDAYIQITRVIEDYLDVLSDIKKVVESRA